MTTSYSIEWLSQSHHSTSTEMEGAAEKMATTLKRHIPCLAQPRPPTAHCKGSLQPKVKSVKKSFLHDVQGGETESDSVSFPRPLLSSSPILSENSGESSGYESETVPSVATYVDGEHGRGDDSGSHRKMRTKFTSDQIYKLENTFNKNKYLGTSDRLKVAAKLHLSETQVKTWFQNRRMKLKREVQDLRPDFLSPALMPQMMYQPVSSLQHFNYQGQQFALPPRSPDNLAAHHLYPSLMQQMSFPQSQLHHLLLASVIEDCTAKIFRSPYLRAI
ncbi:homeobox protein vent1B-like [Acipenser ruthenus]|uniref:homeobox protein vent1B-like n=1 Tax=Acipenser ruthenus TaxID=7906 RepID=UPI00274166A8|nr:homeobox protein vent1B-like [Acipenser ruthenus]